MEPTLVMSENFSISIIVPFYNSEKHIDNCLQCLIKQDLTKPIEIILIDDASSDKSLTLAKKFNLPNIKIYNLKKNSGPATARNLGLKHANGDFIFFLDVDDIIEKNTLSLLYYSAIEKNYDLTICDSKWIENSKNQRNNIYSFEDDKVIENKEITQSMRERLFYNSKSISAGGILGCKGKLIKNSVIKKNNIWFEENLRYLEDEVFLWDLLAHIDQIKYIRKQLYSYFVYPNVNSAIVEGLNLGFPISKFKLIRNHIKQSFLNRGCEINEGERIGDQAFIFYIINVLISISKSILQGKVEKKKGLENRKKIIKSIIDDTEVSKAIKNYKRSKDESYWLPLAIFFKSQFGLEIACTNRAKFIINKRREINKIKLF